MKPKTKHEEKKVWVEIEVNKYTDNITVFRGQILKVDLDAWARGELIDCAIKLEKTYWLTKHSVCVLGKGEGYIGQYMGDTYLRADMIMLIFVLKQDSFPDLLEANKVDNVFTFPGRG